MLRRLLHLLAVLSILLKFHPTPCLSSPQIYVDTDDFKSLVMNNDLFVDKTLLIEEFNRMLPGSFVPLIVRPSGWGKSTNMDMLKRFYEIETDEFGQRLTANQTVNDKLFLGGKMKTGSDTFKMLKPLKISKISGQIEFLGKNPVISLKLGNVTGKSYQELEQSIKSHIVRAFQPHKYLLNESWVPLESQHFGFRDLKRFFAGDFNSTDLQKSLHVLSACLYDYFKRRVVILIDDHDTPLINAFLEFGDRQMEYDKAIDLLDSTYKWAIKGNIFMYKALFTGIMRISFDTVAHPVPKLDNLELCTLFYRHFFQHYGFTRSEVRDLLDQWPTPALDLDLLISWYGGYDIYEQSFLNDRLVMRCLSQNGSTGYYDSDIASNALVDRILSNDDFQPSIQSLISGQKLNVNNFFYLTRFRGHLLKQLQLVVLIHYGYLNKTGWNVNTQVAIPNKEIQHFYEMKTMHWIANKFGVSSSQFSSFGQLLLTDQIDSFRETLPKYLSNATEFIRSGIEKAITIYDGLAIALRAALSQTHEKQGHIPDGQLLVPKLGRNDLTIVFKYKLSKKLSELASVAKALVDDINSCDNCTDFRMYWHVRKVHKIGVAFCGIHAAVESRFEELKQEGS